MTAPAARLDAFTDAAFAFAVTLLVAGGSGGDMMSDAGLVRLVAGLPAFAIGFMIIAMFWNAHVRWRHFRGDGDWRSLLLSLLLVFLVLAYVFPLRGMAASLGAAASGHGEQFRGSIGTLFTVYGAGFTAMAGTTAALFADAARAAPAPLRAAVRGEMLIWLILAATGIVSTCLAAMGGLAAFVAPWAYATLPATIGLFALRWRWDDAA